MRAITPVLVIVVALTGIAAPASATTEERAEPLDAVIAVSPNVVNTAEITIGGVAEHAIEARISQEKSGSLDVSVPVSPGDDITVESGVTVSIGLPFGEKASDAVSERPGIVSYDNNNESSTLAAVLSDGSIQISSVIDSPEAPRHYSYPIVVPPGSTLVADGSGARIVGEGGDVLGVFEAPWAFDADGVAVPTRYEIKGNTLTQVVEHNDSFAYPVVADPTYVTTTYYWSRANVETMWGALNNINGVCHVLPLSFFVGLGCYPPASLSDAIASAHYQKKRIKAVYYNCGMNWCNYYKYYVIT